MAEQSLPKNYEGYSTEELLEVLKMRLAGQSLEKVPRGKIVAMGHFDREYRLSPVMKASQRLKGFT
jgi:hypothetical protein